MEQLLRKVVCVIDDMLMIPLGIKVARAATERIGNSQYMTPLVIAPAIICAYVASFLLEQKFNLECDIMSVTDICDHGEWSDFLPKLASSILAAWTIVNAAGVFLIHYGSDVVFGDDMNTVNTEDPASCTDNAIETLYAVAKDHPQIMS